MIVESRYSHPQYLLSRQIRLSINQHLTISDPSGEPVFFVLKKGFKLKEDIRVYADSGHNQELISIQARQIIDFSGAFDVIDSISGFKIGSLRRKGINALVRDEWTLLDASDREVGMVIEDSLAMALIRRMLARIIPQNYDVYLDGQVVGDLRQRFNPFLYKLEIDFRQDPHSRLDRRLGLAAGILLATIEGRQR